MRWLAPALALLTLAVAVAVAVAQQPAGEHAAAVHPARITFDSFTPARLQILTGESVTWTNGSARAHTVTADDGSFGSGRLAMSERFSHEFGAIGEVPYHCALHPFMRGVVAATDLLLDAPSQAASPKRPFPLSGRSAMSTGTPVSIEADHGTGFAPVAATTVGPGGTFVVRLQPTATARYRAVAGAAMSSHVVLVVLDRRVVLRLQRRRGRVLLRASVTPPSRGGHVVLQLFLPERFGWWPVQRTRLDRASSARFTVRTRRRLKARVVLTLPDGATRLAVSPTVRVGRRR
ncbi:MAG TPA: hypothetical protein VNT54_00225 [Solirubrobacteraceae bacterium]|nr:hypothetical protein [Solirubrobacteraceae bacterium]